MARLSRTDDPPKRHPILPLGLHIGGENVPSVAYMNEPEHRRAARRDEEQLSSWHALRARSGQAADSAKRGKKKERETTTEEREERAFEKRQHTDGSSEAFKCSRQEERATEPNVQNGSRLASSDRGQLPLESTQSKQTHSNRQTHPANRNRKTNGWWQVPLGPHTPQMDGRRVARRRSPLM